MPIHDWSKVQSGNFHDFHQDWTIEIRRTLNSGLLPPGYSAVVEFPELDDEDFTELGSVPNRLLILREDQTTVAEIDVVLPEQTETTSSQSRSNINFVRIDLFAHSIASYDAGNELTAYVDPVAVGDTLPDVPLFLAPGWYINIPLEATYERSWSYCPPSIRELFSEAR
jgi:hypothetical protein